MATMDTSQRLPFVLDPRFANNPDGTPGGPAPIQGVPVYASSDETAAVVVVDPADPSGKTGWYSSVAPTGLTPCRMTITVDADLGDGVVNLVAVSEDVTVTQAAAPQAQVLQFSFSPAVAKP